jgi:anti-sigma regulatory factor (Ser/Thr protein kinase)
VTAGIDGSTCVIEVIDRGMGFDASETVMPHTSAEDGRGLLLMHAVSDRVIVTRELARGTTVRIEKQLANDASG